MIRQDRKRKVFLRNKRKGLTVRKVRPARTMVPVFSMDKLSLSEMLSLSQNIEKIKQGQKASQNETGLVRYFTRMYELQPAAIQKQEEKILTSAILKRNQEIYPADAGTQTAFNLMMNGG